MRTGVRVSPSWLGGVLRSRIRCSRLIIGALEKSLADGAGHTFFKILDCALGLRMMPGTGRKLAIVHGPQLPAHRLNRDDDFELLEHPLAQVNKPPAHHTVHSRNRPIFHHASQSCAMFPCQPRRLTPRLAGNEPRWAPGVELHHPVPDDLKRHAADLRRLGARRPAIDRSQRQKPPRLAAVLRLPRVETKLGSVKILSKRDRHRKLLRSQHRIKSPPIRESPYESQSAGVGSLHKAAASSFLFVVMVAISVKRSMVLFGVRGMAIGAIIRGLSLISVRPAQCIKRRV